MADVSMPRQAGPAEKRTHSSLVSQRYRPALLGTSVGHPEGSVGSIGPFVRLADGRHGFISTCFAVAPKHARVGDFIHQPAPSHLEVLTSTSRVGVLAKVVAPKPGVPSSVAAAVVAWIEGAGPHQHILPPWSEERGRAIVGLAEPSELSFDDEVAVVGCGSVYSRGRLTTVRMMGVKVEDYIFNDVIEVRGLTGQFSHTGDGGGLVYRCADCKAIGLLFARTKEVEGLPKSLMLPLRPALLELGATLMT